MFKEDYVGVVGHKIEIGHYMNKADDFDIVRQAMEEGVDSDEIRQRKYTERQRSYIRSLETELRQITKRQQVLERTIARLKENLKDEE